MELKKGVLVVVFDVGCYSCEKGIVSEDQLGIITDDPETETLVHVLLEDGSRRFFFKREMEALAEVPEEYREDPREALMHVLPRVICRLVKRSAAFSRMITLSSNN